ncbi:MAG: hypothetical protein WCL11_08150, partial [Verrucomicrobiota bacterium]
MGILWFWKPFEVMIRRIERVSSRPLIERQKMTNTLILLVKSENGAGEGNRTLISGLGSPHS